MNSIQKRVACISTAALTIMCLLGLCICTMGTIVLREKRIAEQRKQAEQERVDEAVRAIRDSLYVPAGAVVVYEFQPDYLFRSPDDCIGSAIEITYGINRSFDEVLTEYHQALLKAEWTSYRQVEGYAVYLKGPQVELIIDKIDEVEPLVTPTPTPPVWRPFTTTYVVTITYMEPSNRECID